MPDYLQDCEIAIQDMERLYNLADGAMERMRISGVLTVLKRYKAQLEQ